MWSLRRVLLLGAALRAVLLCWGVWQDAHSAIRYTDIDYDVFTDAARALAAGGSPVRPPCLLTLLLLSGLLLRSARRVRSASPDAPRLGCARSTSGTRTATRRCWPRRCCPTYGSTQPGAQRTHARRATNESDSAHAPALPPALSLSLSVPRGKVLFSAADLLVAWLTASTLRASGASSRAASVAAAASLFNPLTAAVSTRGSCDALVAALTLATLRAALAGRPAAAGALLGAATHLRIFPMIHALPLALFFLGAAGERADENAPAGGAGAHAGGKRRRERGALLRFLRFVTPAIAFCAAAAASFLLLFAGCYARFGAPFVQHAYLYHAGRSDPRHNFSAAFYGAYLRHGAPAALRASARVASAAQAAVLLGAGVALRRDPPAALAAQTLAFVAFNRVITAQYFAWWMALAPLVAPAALMPHRRKRCAAAAAAWAAAQLHWLAHAAALEFGAPSGGGGGGAFARVWGASLLFFGASVALLSELLAAYAPRDLRRVWAVAAAGKEEGKKRE
jgi:phosphatidylinositol glycan class M